jgi:hypothetical protein
VRLYTLKCPNCGRELLKNLVSLGRSGDIVVQCECNATVELYWKGGNEVLDEFTYPGTGAP